uniref:Uncharacterized protein n=1 Tax=Parastrongyloides trichosuri TaxID=131310 RepID=A0A0N4Z0C5_PARTI
MLSQIYYCDRIYSPYTISEDNDIIIISPNTLNNHVTDLKNKFEEVKNHSNDNKNLSNSKKTLNKTSAKKLLESRGFTKEECITYGALTLPDYKKSDTNIDRENNKEDKEKEKLWTPIRNQPNVKVSSFIKNLENINKNGVVKETNECIQQVFDNLKDEISVTPLLKGVIPSGNKNDVNTPLYHSTSKGLRPKELFQKRKNNYKNDVCTGLQKLIKTTPFSKNALEKLHKKNRKKIKDSEKIIKAKGSVKDLRNIFEEKRLRNSNIPVLITKLINKKSFSNYETIIEDNMESEC